MIKVDLITGFLGAGKTSFLLRYAQYLMDQGLRIGILIYDHGAVNVDLPLLQELRGERCELETLAGGCDADCHRRRFRTKLITMGMSGYDRVLIEPSGVFDMDEFYDTLNESPLDRWYEAGSVIAIWDATLGEEDSPEADFFLASQAAGAGCLVLSKTQLATPERKAQSLVHLQNALKRIHAAPIPAERILDKNWDDLTEDLAGGGYNPVAAGYGLTRPPLPETAADELETTLTHSRNLAGRRLSIPLLSQSSPLPRGAGGQDRHAVPGAAIRRRLSRQGLLPGGRALVSN